MAEQPIRAKAVFDEAVQIELASERKAYLDRVCQADSDLRRDVENLLEAHAAAGAFLESPDPAVAATLDLLEQERPGAMIGPYRLLEQIGEGGMGLVFVAEQQQPVRRKVALKVIKPGMDTREVIARFEAERQALAIMDHPHIARVLDAGATASGRPFFVMELVRGLAITDYCDRHQVAPRERLELFVGVCQAVQHAHLKGIIHRDIKPSNVLVSLHDAQPVVKVIDFGVAKAVGGSLTERTVHTRFSQMIGTPLYMSPEQAEMSGLDIDTRTDVYSLGVLLYELLTGVTPFDRDRLKKAAYDEIRRIIREEEPPKPSTRLSGADSSPSVAAQRRMEPKKLSAMVRGDLDWIVMKALEKDRTRRYETVSSMAQDVQRFLTDDPVEARPPSAAYRFWKLCRKYRVALQLTALFVLLLLIGSGVSVWQAVRATHAEASAVRQRNAAQKARDAEKRQRNLADAREKIAQRHLYAAQLGLSAQALKAGRMASLGEFLEATRPASTGGHELRGWEWFHLYRRWGADVVRFPEHMGSVLATAVDPSGRLAASADDQGAVFLWDTATGLSQWRMHPFAGAVLALAFSPDGNDLAAGGEDSAAAIFDVKTGQQRHELEGHVLAINEVAYSRDGQLLATAGRDNTIKIWDTKSWREIVTLKGHASEVRHVWFHQMGNRLASVGDDRVLRFWSLPDGKEDEQSAVKPIGSTIALTPDFNRLAFRAADRQAVVLLELEAREAVAEFPGYQSPVVGLSFSADGALLATADEDGDTVVWDIQPQRLVSNYRAQATNVALSSNGERVVSACADGIVRVWPARSRELTDFVGHDGGTRCVAVHPSKPLLATGDSTGSVRIWDSQTGKLVHTLGLHIALRGPPGTPPGNALEVAAGKPLRAKVHMTPPGGRYLADTLREVWVYEGHHEQAVALAFSPDGETLASAGDKEIRLWGVDDGRERTLLRHPQRVTSVAFSPDGKLLATGCWDDAVRIWEIATGREKFTLRGHGDNVDAVVFHPNSRQVASAGVDQVVRIWDVVEGRPDRVLKGHDGRIQALAFSPNGELLASGSMDQTIRLWNFATGESRAVLRGHTERVTALAFHPTEDRLVSASNHAADGAVRVWDLAIGREIVSLPSPIDLVHGLAFDPAGKSLAVTAGRRIVIWKAADREATSPVPPQRASAGSRRRLEIAAPGGPKVLGWQRAAKLPRMHETTPFLPAVADHEFLILVLSVPRALLYPNRDQHGHLQRKARQDPEESPAGPIGSYSLYDPQRFALILEGGKNLPAFAIGPLPFVFGQESGGFNQGITVELSTSTFERNERSLMAVMWELPTAEIAGRFGLRLDQREPVPVPEVELQGYQGDYHSSRRATSARDTDLLVEQRTYSKF